MNLLRAAPNVNEKIVHGVNEIINECKTIRDSDRLVSLVYRLYITEFILLFTPLSDANMARKLWIV